MSTCSRIGNTFLLIMFVGCQLIHWIRMEKIISMECGRSKRNCNGNGAGRVLLGGGYRWVAQPLPCGAQDGGSSGPLLGGDHFERLCQGVSSQTAESRVEQPLALEKGCCLNSSTQRGGNVWELTREGENNRGADLTDPGWEGWC